MELTVGLVQDSPVFFDKARTIDKMEFLCSQYAARGCQLLVFPESFIPGYPRGFSFGAVVGSRTQRGRELFQAYHENSLNLNSEDRQRLESIARNNGIYLVVGATEKEDAHGSLFCSMVYISPEKGVLGVHRKIKPTASERLVWAEGAGDGLVSFDTRIGRIGGLICWENYMPLARMAMYRQGLQLYIAPTADCRDSWTTTLQHIALEGRCFVLGCNQYFTREMYPEAYREEVADLPLHDCTGGSCIVSPMGNLIAGPLHGEPGLLMATLDLSEIPRSRMDFDVNGHYDRKDIFELLVRGQPGIMKE